MLRSKKKRLIKAAKRSTPAPIGFVLKVLGKRRTHRWRLNRGQRRNWRSRKLKA